MSEHALGYGTIRRWTVLALSSIILALVFGVEPHATPVSAQASVLLNQVNPPSGAPGDIIVLAFQLANNAVSPPDMTITVTNLPAGVVATNPGVLIVPAGTNTTFVLNLSLPRTIGAGSYAPLVAASYAGGGQVSTFGRFTVVGSPIACTNLPLIRK